MRTNAAISRSLQLKYGVSGNSDRKYTSDNRFISRTMTKDDENDNDNMNCTG